MSCRRGRARSSPPPVRPARTSATRWACSTTSATRTCRRPEPVHAKGGPSVVGPPFAPCGGALPRGGEAAPHARPFAILLRRGLGRLVLLGLLGRLFRLRRPARLGPGHAIAGS